MIESKYKVGDKFLSGTILYEITNITNREYTLLRANRPDLGSFEVPRNMIDNATPKEIQKYTKLHKALS